MEVWTFRAGFVYNISHYKFPRKDSPPFVLVVTVGVILAYFCKT